MSGTHSVVCFKIITVLNFCLSCSSSYLLFGAQCFVIQGAGKLRSLKTETQIGNLQFLHVYITYIRLSKTVERNLLMAESMKSNLPTLLQKSLEECIVEPGPVGKKISKPEDLVRIYDTVLQVAYIYLFFNRQQWWQRKYCLM